MSADIPEPLLFERFPSLRGIVPFRRLGKPNTPNMRLEAIENLIGAEIWVKRDDLYACPGGGKVRKLEFSLAKIIERGRKSVITFGPVGSNHVAATAIYGLQLGLNVVGILVPQPFQHYLRSNLECSCANAEIRFRAWSGSLPFMTARAWNRERRRTGIAPAILPPGGSSLAGMLGYVEVALEIARDITEGRLPKPDYILVPAGTCGSLAGLTAGIRISGLDIIPLGVRVCTRLSCNVITTAWLANRVLSFLRKNVSEIRKDKVKARDVTMLHKFCGRGYGRSTSAGKDAVKLALSAENLHFDATYTGKAFAGLLEFMSAPQNKGKRMLMINTWAPPVETRLDSGVCLIPPKLKAWLSKQEALGSDHE